MPKTELTSNQKARLTAIRQIAKHLSITPTSAAPFSELWKCWADRVELAQLEIESGRFDTAKDMVIASCAYAVPPRRISERDAMAHIQFAIGQTQNTGSLALAS